MPRLPSLLILAAALAITSRLSWRLSQERAHPAYAQLRELSAALQTLREEERKHIARELHDDLGQLLATLRGDLALLQRLPADGVGARQLQQGMD